MIKLLDIENKRVKVTPHCHTISWLSEIMKKFPKEEQHIKIYAYIFYLTCPNSENPYFNIPEDELEEVVEADLDIDFDTEDPVIQKALSRAEKLYTTPSLRMYQGVKQMMDHMATYLATTKITHGRDGNISSLTQLMKNLPSIRDSFKSLDKELDEEQKTIARGGKDMAYDQRQ